MKDLHEQGATPLLVETLDACSNYRYNLEFNQFKGWLEDSLNTAMRGGMVNRSMRPADMYIQISSNGVI
jgi:hypothetical protein